MKRLVIGILAHVDSGKTTLSEAMLYRTGEIRTLGRVDHKNAFLDTHSIERERGITVFSKQAMMHFENAEFTLLDTPGHIDFSTETERTLQVLDYAILVISGSEGVQSHTQTLWRMLMRYNIPTFIFINKMDLSESTQSQLISDIRSGLDSRCINFGDLSDKLNFFENIAMCSDKLMEEFLDTDTICEKSIVTEIYNRNIFPCMFGSALKVEGVDEFLSVLEKYTKNIDYGSKFAAKVFKIADDEKGARLTYMKITGGSLKVKEQLCGTDTSGNEWNEKVNQLRIYSGIKFKAADEVRAGSVCAVTGLSKTYVGEGIGNESDSAPPMLEPVLSYRVVLPYNIAAPTGLSYLRKIEEEDPELNVVWNEQLKEIHIRVMGEVQLDILKSMVSERFNIDIEFDKGSIAYKETIKNTVEGVGHYEPLRHYAEVHLLLEPLECGSGLKFCTDCSEDKLSRNWQRLILTHLEEKRHIGVLTGSPITDMKITLIAGKAHLKHTEGGDFRQATYRALRQGLMMAESELLEPWYDFKLELPAENVGRAMTDLQQMGGEFSMPEINGEMSVISGIAPVSQMREYHKDVTAYTKGKGRLFCTVNGYRPCLNTEEVTAEINYDCESDVSNTPDSVFCAHGAGFVVKWNEVRNYMHIESGFIFETDSGTENKIPENNVREYINCVAGDDELMRIFEKTYGPVKRNIPSVVRSAKSGQTGKVSQSRHKSVSMIGPEYLLVDGYNIIFAWENLKDIANDSLDSARNLLIDILCNYCGVNNCELILVFDAYKVKGNVREIEKVNNITVVYTKEAETADMYIEKVTHELGRKHRVRVATSDNLEQLIILGNGAVRVSASAFKKEVDDAQNAIRKFIMDKKLFQT